MFMLSRVRRAEREALLQVESMEKILLSLGFSHEQDETSRRRSRHAVYILTQFLENWGRTRYVRRNAEWIVTFTAQVMRRDALKRENQP